MSRFCLIAVAALLFTAVPIVGQEGDSAAPVPQTPSGPCVRLEVLIAKVAFDADGQLRLGEADAEPNRVGMLGAGLAAKMNEEKASLAAGLTAGTAGANLLLESLAKTDRLQALERFQLVLTTDGKDVILQDGRRQPRVTGVQTSSRGQVNNVSLENMGTLISGSARLTPTGKIRLNIAVERSAFAPEECGTPVAVSDGKTIRTPRVDTTTLETELLLADGETEVLASLIHAADNLVTECFVLVTPKILKP